MRVNGHVSTIHPTHVHSETIMSKQRNVCPPASLLAFVLLLGAAAGCSSTRSALPPAAEDPSVVAVFGDDVLTLDEFEERYARSVGSHEAAADDSLAALRDFLDRYVNFRLKVRAAEAAGLGASPEIRQEIDTYRANLARPYLLEQEVLEPIIRDLYAKQQEIIDVSHLLIRVAPDAAPSDTLAAYEKISALADSLAAGTDFGDLAFRHSEDPSARSRNEGPGYRGRIGFFSAGRLVEEFEDMAYATPVGAVSPVFRTQFGYHILKVHDRRPAVDDIQVAHLMLQPGLTAADSAKVQEQIRELKARLDAGEDFATLARQYSADRTSGERGGDLGYISYDAPIVPSFKEAAFALENPGDVSDVVETRFGYHLIKLLDRKPRPTYEEAYNDLKQAVARLPRAQKAEEALAARVLAEHGARVDTALVVRSFEGVPADSVFSRLVQNDLHETAFATPILTIGDSTYHMEDLATFARSARVARGADTETQVRSLLSQFVTARAIDYEAMTLEERDAEFRQVMEEFRDGLVLFKLMEDSVWTAAEQDSAALVAHYEAHRDRYQFPERSRIVGLHSRSDSALAAIAGRLDAGATLAELQAELVADTLQTVRIDTMLIAGQTGSIYDQALALPVGQHTEPIANRGSFVVLVHDGRVPAGPKSFEEARTEVVSQYQQELEAALIERLRRHYRAVTFPERLQQAFGQTPGAPGQQAASTR